MTMLFADSFDYYSTSEIDRKWNTTSGSPTIASGTKRNGAQALTFATASSSLYYAPPGGTFTDAQAILGFAFHYDSSFPISAAVHPLIYFYNDLNNQVQSSLYLTNAAQLQIRRSTTAILGTGTATLLADTWYYIEIKMRINNSISANDVIVRVDETEDINLAAGSDTQLSISSSMGNLVLGRPGANGGGNLFYDDFYILDWEGSDNNDFLGDVVVEALWPSGNGNSSQLVGSDADSTDNYLHVDDTTPDDDTSYVESDTTTEKDTYAFDDLSNTPSTIYGVAANIQAKKTEQLARSIKAQTRVNATDYEGDEQFLATSYGNLQHIWENNPDDAAAWEEADVNGAEFGLKVHA